MLRLTADFPKHPATFLLLNHLPTQGDVPEELVKSATQILINIWDFKSSIPVPLLELVRLASERGDGTAAVVLGSCFDHGVGYPQNVEKAADMYERSANFGDAWGKYNYAMSYLRGRGRKKDPHRALVLMRESYEGNFPAAAKGLGIFYEEGKAVQKDLDLAASFYQEGIDAGNAEALYRMARLYIIGEKGYENLEVGLELRRKSADMGCAIALSYIGSLHLSGIHLEKDHAIAFKYLAVGNL